jgi:hypothetical protein
VTGALDAGGAVVSVPVDGADPDGSAVSGASLEGTLDSATVAAEMVVAITADPSLSTSPSSHAPAVANRIPTTTTVPRLKRGLQCE